MDKNHAMKQIKLQLQKFKYIYKQTLLQEDLWHFSFKMDIGLPDIQMTLEFHETFFDVLAFPHPVIANNENYNILLKMVNYINWNTKSMGRMYIDDNFDIAYSLRIKYNMFEKMPILSMQEIEFSVDIYADVIKILYNISSGGSNYEEGKRKIDLVWGVPHE